jgi:CRISPR-associated exonuclease Cas4
VASSELLSAADIEKFGYCPLSWWLSRGMAPEEGSEIVEGEKKHSAVSEDLKGIEADEAAAREAEAAVLYFSVAASIIAIVGVTFVVDLVTQLAQLLSAISLIWLLSSVYFLYRAEHLSSDEEHFLSERVILGFAMAAAILAVAAVSLPGFVNPLLSQAFMALALAWLIGATMFLYRNMRSAETARTTRAKYRITSGSLVYVDSEREKPKLFVSKRYGLSGRPDAVLLEGDIHVPVEVKTGRSPKGPLFSHILQIAAYCLLMEEEYGKAPPHGVIRYGDASHEIEYNEDLKKLVLEKMAQMRACIVKGEAHRNHNRPGKCVHCSRRSVCPERLA